MELSLIALSPNFLLPDSADGFLMSAFAGSGTLELGQCSVIALTHTHTLAVGGQRGW